MFAALAVSRLVEDCTARRYRTVQIRAGQHLLTAEDPLPDALRKALAQIIKPEGATNR